MRAFFLYPMLLPRPVAPGDTALISNPVLLGAVIHHTIAMPLARCHLAEGTSHRYVALDAAAFREHAPIQLTHLLYPKSVLSFYALFLT